MTECAGSSRQSAVRAIADQGGTVLVIGGSDTGKTEFCKELLRAVLRKGRTAAWIDADIGQSTIGPPSTVGMCVLRWESDLDDESRRAELYFVGSTSPTGYVVPLLVGVRNLLDLSLDADPGVTAIDTTGLVTGEVGTELKRRKVEIVGPRHLVAFQREGELDALLRPYRHVTSMNLIRLPVAAEVRRRSRAERREHREECFRRYFLRASLHAFRLEDISVWGHWIDSGSPLEGSDVARLSEILGSRVHYAELMHDQLMLFAGTPVGLLERERAREEFRVMGVHLHSVGELKDRLVALHGGRGETLALGTVHEFHQEERSLSIRVPLEDVHAVKGIIFGGIKVNSAGCETSVP